MEIFLVGGAVRDKLMGIESNDNDFVVVGSSPEEMLSLGFTQVGADFPVFLHPVTKDEHALARTERKTGDGHKGFECDWKGVTLEEDLARRDLTINSIAMAGDTIIDPFNGVDDIKNKVLRHTSDAFAEDPLRVLRIARFMARFGGDWCIHPDTFALMRTIAARGDLKHLTAERIWKELSRALMEPHPELFFETMEGLGVFDELDALRGVEQRADHHPEVDTFIHIMMCLKQAVKLGLNLEQRFAVLCHDFGKRPAMDEFGKLHGHEEMGVPLVESFCRRVSATKNCRDLAVMVAEHHTKCHTAFVLKASTMVNLFITCDGFRRPARFIEFIACCEADARGRLGFEDRDYSQNRFVSACFDEALSVDTRAISNLVKDRVAALDPEVRATKNIGSLIADGIRAQRIRNVKQVMNSKRDFQMGKLDSNLE